MYFVDNTEYVFTLFHNFVNERRILTPAKIGYNCDIHESVIMDVAGLKVVIGPNNEKIQFKHTGCIKIGDNVEIGPNSIIHRGTMGETVIKDGVKMGAMTNIAHNCEIGENTVFAVGVILNGSVTIGSNCWVGSGALIRNGVSICF